MATNLPTISVTDPQLNLLLTVFTDATGYTTWLKTAIVAEVKRRKQAEIHAQYVTALNNLNTQELDAIAQIEVQLASVIGS